jgi:phage shock protein A
MARPNPIVKAWKYMSAWLGAKVEEKADPKIQIQQAIQEAKTQHHALTQQAAAVIGNQRQLEMQLDRQLGQIETLQAQAKQALMLADKAKAEGDAEKSAQFEQTAQALANQLVNAESSVEDLKKLHDQSLRAAVQARQAVQDSASRLQKQLAERTKLLTQLEQAKMQESVSKSLQQMSDLAAPSNVPSLEDVRAKIEKRYATALGQAELANDSVAGRIIEVERATVEMQGAARLEEIRASINTEQAAVAPADENATIEATDADSTPAPAVDTTKQSQPRAGD